MAWVLALALAGCSMGNNQPSPNATPSPVAAAPSPAPLAPDDLLARALHRRAVGEYDSAANDLYTLTTSYPDDSNARAARFYLAESYALRGRWNSAVAALQSFLAERMQDDWHARALFWLARCQEEQGAHADAIATYEQYRALQTPLEPYAHLREAALRQTIGQAEAAASNFEAAAGTDIARGERAGAYEKAIAVRRQLGQNDRAWQDMQRLVELAQTPEYRARILLEAAALAHEVGAVEQARAWLREIAEHMPETPQALDAVIQLMNDPQSGLQPAVAAHVYDVHEQYASALPQYDAAIVAASGETKLDLQRQQALVRRALGDFAGASSELVAVSAAAPNSDVGLQAQLDFIQTRGQSGDTQAAIDGYREFAVLHPNDERAPEALSRAAILLGRLGNNDGALQQQIELGKKYPQSAQGQSALDALGWHFFNAGQPAEALAAWQPLSQSSSGSTAAEAAFWGARAAQQAGQDAQASKLLEAAIKAAPDSYYAARAADLLKLEPQGRVAIGSPIDDAAWRVAEDWLAGWSGQAAYHVAEQSYPAEVAQQGPVQRAIALAEVGLQPEAIGEWNEARDRWAKDPQKLYFVARLAHENQVPYIGLKATEDLMKLAPAKAPPAPEALRRLLFPTPYSDEVLAWSRQYNLDPRALYALLRQESLFNPGATSWVGARGLAQVMPTTAEGIAQRLNVDGFQDTDLYRPAVSVRFGAFYLSNQIAAMNGSLQAAFAAYNGGPGNAQRWANGDTVADPDVFAENIDYPETRDYVKLVYGYYGAYQELYTLP
jgi:soluble lytic murein transglycosylase